MFLRHIICAAYAYPGSYNRGSYPRLDRPGGCARRRICFVRFFIARAPNGHATFVLSGGIVASGTAQDNDRKARRRFSRGMLAC